MFRASVFIETLFIMCSGSIDMKEFLLAMLAMKRVEEAYVVPVIATSPTQSPGTTSSDVSALPIGLAPSHADDAKLYFDMFDVKQTGYIDIDELKLVMDFMVPVEDVNNKEVLNVHVEEMFQFMDRAKNGRVEFDEFKEFYNAVMVATTMMKINSSTNISLATAIDIVHHKVPGGNRR